MAIPAVSLLTGSAPAAPGRRACSRLGAWQVLACALLWLVPAACLASAAADDAAPQFGPITLHVDMSRAPQRILVVHERIPVKPGRVSLNYPRWIPGEHRPAGPIANVAGLTIRADGERLDWRRDLHDMYRLHVAVPTGVDALELSFQYLAPRRRGHGGARPSTSHDLAVLAFSEVLFYPAGRAVTEIDVRPSVTLPEGWRFASALTTAGTDGRTVHFEPLSLARLVDSPLLTGRRLHSVALGEPGGVPVRLDVAGDRGVDIHPNHDQITALRSLRQQLLRLFGAAPYRHYDLLLALSDGIGYYSLGHRQSADLRLPPELLSDPATLRLLTPLLAHEWVHAWNGKWRRPEPLLARDFNSPMATNLAWFHEGLTDYLAMLASVRSGLWTPEYFRAALAATVNSMRHRSGRAWRDLQDTADAARLLRRGGHGWRNWRRGADFHSEGLLLWLDVDTKIRALSDGRRSLDDFTRRFFAVGAKPGAVTSYDFDAIVAALDAVQPLDWAAFLRQRLDYTGSGWPYHGLQRAGWKLARSESPGARAEDLRSLHYGLNLAASLGLSLGHDGRLRDVQWHGPASAAGLIPGMKVVAVNGQAFSPERVLAAIRAAADEPEAIRLLTRDGDLYRRHAIDYHGGLRYPHLERIDGQPDRLAAIIAPLPK